MSPAPADKASIRELEVGETRLAHQAMRALRPAYEDREEFAAHVDGLLRPGGYRIVAALVPDREQAVAVAGFRASRNLSWGHHLYVDDLSTLPEARGRGHAGALLDWVLEEARRLGCEQLHLDSGVGLERSDAHRLYLNAGLVISAHHFARLVG
jgi:GNAT superfamily N-acetyltransferase